jgi:hypothetical protein
VSAWQWCKFCPFCGRPITGELSRGRSREDVNSAHGICTVCLAEALVHHGVTDADKWLRNHGGRPNIYIGISSRPLASDVLAEIQSKLRDKP